MAKLSKHDRVVLIFGAKWCKNCNILNNDILLIDENELKLPIFKIDVDILPLLAEKYEATRLPTSIILHLNHKSEDIYPVYVGSNIEAFKSWIRNSSEGRLENKVPIRTLVDVDSVEPIIPEILEIAHDIYNEQIPQKQMTSFVSEDIQFINLVVAVGLGNMDIKLNDISNLNNGVKTIFSNEDTFTEVTIEELEKLYEYKIPTVSADGTCSNLDKLASKPFNLALNAYHIEYSPEILCNHLATYRLIKLGEIVNILRSLTNADWIGLYRVVLADNIPTLLKEAYFGEPSRPLFPMSKEFAVKSTNSWVGLTGNARVIPNTRLREEGVSYYECSGKVQSELCVPILREISSGQYQTIGIIDLESWNVNHFTSIIILEVLKVAFDLGNINFGI